MNETSHLQLLASPHIRLHGGVDYGMYNFFRSAMDNHAGGALVVAMTTLGGDPEIARVMGEDVRLFCQNTGCPALFLGRVAVYSAGATFMSFFLPENRYCTHGTRIMIHERQIARTININGPLRDCVGTLKAVLHEIEESIAIEEEGFANLITKSDIGIDEVRAKANCNWYIGADQAQARGLIAGVI